jgi:hypothetical protein
VGEIEQHEDAVHHGVAQGDQSVEAAPLKGIDEVLHEKVKSHLLFLQNKINFHIHAILFSP